MKMSFRCVTRIKGQTMIFQKTKGNHLESVENVGFPLEKDVQHLIEQNMTSFFGLRFLETEFAIGEFRFDSVAFDDEANSFVIIEDKNVENKGLVDQGYAYLKTALDRKADLVLLYNQKMGKSLQIEDFAWDQLVVYFVSPRFTKYQTEAVCYEGMPFRLFQIQNYEGGLVDLEEIIGRKIPGVSVPKQGEDSLIGKVTKAIKVYSEEDHIRKSDDERKSLYQELKNRAFEIASFEVVVRKLYVSYKSSGNNVFDVVFEKNKLVVFLNLAYGTIKDLPDSTLLPIKNVVKVGHWGNGDYEIFVSKKEQLDYLMPLIRFSFLKNK